MLRWVMTADIMKSYIKDERFSYHKLESKSISEARNYASIHGQGIGVGRALGCPCVVVPRQ